MFASRRYVDREVEHLRELLEQRLSAMDHALDMQAREYERRLGVLNHAHEHAVEAAAKTVSDERYESDMKALDEKIGATRDKVISTAGGLAVAAVVVGWLVQYLIRFL